MDLKKLNDDDKMDLCRKYYIGGFYLLPFLWLVNCIWFFREAFLRPQFTHQAIMKTYVIRSTIGVLVWFIILTTWVTIYQKYRVNWGATADYMSFIIPQGVP